MSSNNTLELIEKKRAFIKKIYESSLYDDSVLTDGIVLKKSRELDELLNNYYKIAEKQE